MTTGGVKSWCVLRMSGPATLGVAAALRDSGFEAWTPIYMENRRVGRQRKKVLHQGPLLPSFVFADHDRLGELVAFSHSPAQTFQVWDAGQRRMVTRGCAHFSVMRHGGQYVTVPDRALDALRQCEQRGRAKDIGRVLRAGDRVKYPEAGFQGLVGVVHSVHKRVAMVYFEGFAHPAFAPTFSLLAA